ncbi:hypothetical protein D3C85_1002030 [compost metagenome]
MSSKVSVSFPFLSMLCLLFIGLKLAAVGVVATWSWWWVMSPIWIPVAIFLTVITILGILVAIVK